MTCGAWGGCPLPKGHNRGKLDVPSNHEPPRAERSHLVRYALLWASLVLLALLWGFLSGVAFAKDGFFLDPASALFGDLGLLVIAASLVVAARARR